MIITHEEYEMQRPVFLLCDWISQKLNALEQLPDFEELYFERPRKEPLMKKLLEEAIPLAYFGLSLWKPWRKVLVTCKSGNQPYDGELEVSDPQNSHVQLVEVSTAEIPENVLRRQKLARDGFTHLTGSVWRKDRTIHSEGEMVDVYEESARIQQLAFERFQIKADKETDQRTTILIHINTYHTVPWSIRAQLIEQTHQYLMAQNPHIAGAFYCYSDRGVEGFQRSQQGRWM